MLILTLLFFHALPKMTVQADWENHEFIFHISLDVYRLFDFSVSNLCIPIFMKLIKNISSLYFFGHICVINWNLIILLLFQRLW